MHGPGKFYGLLHVFADYAPNDYGPPVQHLGALRGSADEHRWEAEHGALLGQCAAVGEDAEGVPLEFVVVQEAEGLQAADQWMENEVPRLDDLPAPRVGGVYDGEAVSLRDVVDPRHEREEVPLVIQVLLPVGGEENVPVLLEVQPFQHGAFLYTLPVCIQHLPHGGSRDEDMFLPEALGKEVSPGVLGVGEVDVRNMVHYLPVDLFGDVLIEAPVPRLHVEDGDLEPLRRDG